MQVLYESQDLWTLVEEGYREPNEGTPAQVTEFRENKKKDKKALFLLYQAVNEFVFERIFTAKTVKEAWDPLYKAYRGEELVKTVRLQTLRCEFDSLRMKETESIEDFYNRIIVLLNKLRVNGETINDQRVVEKVLRSLTRKFEYVVVAIEESRDITNLSLESLLGILQSHELRLKQFEAPSLENAFQNMSLSKQKDYQNKENQQEQFNKGRKHWSQLKCYNCNKIGHTSRFCKRRSNEEKGNSSFTHKEEGSSSGIQKEDELDLETMFMIFNMQEDTKKDLWYLDSGCGNHMTGIKDLFVSLDETVKKKLERVMTKSFRC
ncbi:hypothetical protein E3N88_43245 [Mikania micrantha]|uniref:CCHC-type domain-containing protein n=1 Tax=Mikania micrantha TaxID=192012 RepID=A0A5N6LFG6_9ASTR|nr:hypothetical protein E3N88_43245 [Mikania micrantha]